MKRPPILDWKYHNTPHGRFWMAASLYGGVVFVGKANGSAGWKWGYIIKNKLKSTKVKSKKEGFAFAVEEELKMCAGVRDCSLMLFSLPSQVLTL